MNNKVFVVTAWNDTKQEDYVGVFATRRLATAAWKKIREQAFNKAGQEDDLYGGVSVRTVIGS